MNQLGIAAELQEVMLDPKFIDLYSHYALAETFELRYAGMNTQLQKLKRLAIAALAVSATQPSTVMTNR